MLAVCLFVGIEPDRLTDLGDALTLVEHEPEQAVEAADVAQDLLVEQCLVRVVSSGLGQSVAVGLELEGGAIRQARFALGGVAHKPWRNAEAEAALQGRAANEAAFGAAADLLLREARGFGHNTFKIDLARRAIVRALLQAARGTPQSQSNKKIA